jgi:pyruvate/oxaloacetate carboxyltransferase
MVAEGFQKQQRSIRMAGPRQTTFIDTSLRDGHQSLLATRMSTEQCLRVLPMLKDSGYGILELWGGATLDSALRFTHDDPFDRLDAFYKFLGKDGPVIRSLCRGQNLFGYSPYADNVVVAFVKEAVRSGNRRLRIFDALNDHRNIMVPIMATKTYDGHAEVALSYTTSPIHDTAHFLNYAHNALELGADSLAIKDMAGLLHPHDAYELIEKIQQRFPGVELSLHSHCTNGLATTSYLIGMLLGVDYLDTAYGAMAGGTSQPPVELMNWFAREMDFNIDLDFALAPQIDAELRKIRTELKAVDATPDRFGNPWPAEPDQATRKKIKKAVSLLTSYRKSRDRQLLNEVISIVEDDIMVGQGYPAVDRKQLDAQVPGGMLSNLHNQLKEQDKLDLMPQILEEVPRVRKAAGYVPLVTPTSQIVGTQAAFNVMTEQPYSMMTKEFKAMVAGRYGRLPTPPDPEVLKRVQEAGEEICTKRPADYVGEVDLAAVFQNNNGLVKTQRDALLSILFPLPAKQFFESRAKAAV